MLFVDNRDINKQPSPTPDPATDQETFARWEHAVEFRLFTDTAGPTLTVPEQVAAKRAELETHYLDMTSPFRTAEKFGVLDIIDPRETRQVLCDWVEDAWHVVRGDLPGRHR